MLCNIYSGLDYVYNYSARVTDLLVLLVNLPPPYPCLRPSFLYSPCLAAAAQRRFLVGHLALHHLVDHLLAYRLSIYHLSFLCPCLAPCDHLGK